MRGAPGVEAGAPPPDLVAHWTQETPLAPADATWTALHGGRTNALWRVDGGGRSFVVKLFRPGSDTPLFPNNPAAETAALKALAGSGLAPDLVAFERTGAGPSLVYAHVTGQVWRPSDGPGVVAEALARLHASPAPDTLPATPGGAEYLLAQGRQILAEIGSDGARLDVLTPDAPRKLPEVCPVFLHGDCTAGNALVTETGVTFIDWQCPARGDPTLDIAVFLSPAMQAMSGNPPLTVGEEAAFLAAYADPDVAARYSALAALYHWRMAAYCLWRAARGDAGYADAAELELARLTG